MSEMVPPHTSAVQPSPASEVPPAPGVPSEAAALAIVKPLLAACDSLQRGHRKATCWLFFREVGSRPATGVALGLETLLACRVCRPDVVDADGWVAVRSERRSGLVRYSKTSGTSAMRTHVNKFHRNEANAVDRAVAFASTDTEGMNGHAGGAGSAAATGSAGKRSAPVGSATVGPKRVKDDTKGEILQAIGEIEGTIASLHSAVEALKRKVDNAL